MSLSPNLASEPSSPKDVANDVQVFPIPSGLFTQSFEFEEGEESNSATEFNEHHDSDKLENTCLQKSCEGVVEPPNLEFDDDILSVEYESFACGLNENESLNVGFRIEYESFSFDLIITDYLFEHAKSTFTSLRLLCL